MRARFSRLALALVAAGCMMHISPARADEQAKQAPPDEAAAEEVKAARAEIDSVLGEMRATSQRVRDQLRATRLRGSREQITCVNESLSRSDVAIRTAKESADTSLRAYADGDLWVARDSRRKMREWRDAQRLAARDGFSCSASALPVKSGTTTVTMTVDPKVPRVDPKIPKSGP